MAEPRSGTCAPWATIADLPAPCSNYATNAGLMADALQFASDVLFFLSGRRFPGICSATVRPCARFAETANAGILRGLSPWGLGIGVGGANWYDSWGVCSCNREVRTGCNSLAEITLGGEPLVSIDWVKVDGVTLDPSLYRIDDYRWLVRLPDPDGTTPGWPCCQRMDLPLTEKQTFGAAIKYGRTPPQGVNRITASYACELAKAWDPAVDPKNCRLPNRVVQVARQGVTMQMLDYTKVLDEGLTGLPEVDAWLNSRNPNKLQRRARVWSPDVPNRVRRAGT